MIIVFVISVYFAGFVFLSMLQWSVFYKYLYSISYLDFCVLDDLSFEKNKHEKRRQFGVTTLYFTDFFVSIIVHLTRTSK